MYNFKISPLFFVFALIYIIKGQSLILINSTLTVLLHEMAHAKIAYSKGYIMNRIVLMPYGAVLYGEDVMRTQDAVAIAIAGPLFNLFIATIFFAIWWLIPVVYTFTDSFVYSNISVALFNLIPVFPLDGSRIIIALSKNKIKTLKILRFFGVAISLLLCAGFLVTIFFEINITLGMMGIFLFYGAVSGTKKEMYSHLSSSISFVKDYRNGVEKKIVQVTNDIKLVRLLKMINKNQILTFEVLDNKRKIIKRFEESHLEDYIVKYSSDIKLKRIL